MAALIYHFQHLHQKIARGFNTPQTWVLEVVYRNIRNQKDFVSVCKGSVFQPLNSQGSANVATTAHHELRVQRCRNFWTKEMRKDAE